MHRKLSGVNHGSAGLSCPAPSLGAYLIAAAMDLPPRLVDEEVVSLVGKLSERPRSGAAERSGYAVPRGPIPPPRARTPDMPRPPIPYIPGPD